MPITVIIDPEGNVRGVVQGILYPEEFEEKIKPLLVSTIKTFTQDLPHRELTSI